MALAAPAMAQKAGSIVEAGDTLVSAMMVCSEYFDMVEPAKEN
jgi:hypothetical protein